jgi:hypothetical protein
MAVATGRVVFVVSRWSLSSIIWKEWSWARRSLRHRMMWSQVSFRPPQLGQRSGSSGLMRCRVLPAGSHPWENFWIHSYEVNDRFFERPVGSSTVDGSVGRVRPVLAFTLAFLERRKSMGGVVHEESDSFCWNRKCKQVGFEFVVFILPAKKYNA